MAARIDQGQSRCSAYYARPGRARFQPCGVSGRRPAVIHASFLRVLNGVAHGVTRSIHADWSLKAPVAASQEEIVLAERLRLAPERKYRSEERRVGLEWRIGG